MERNDQSRQPPSNRSHICRANHQNRAASALRRCRKIRTVCNHRAAIAAVYDIVVARRGPCRCGRDVDPRYHSCRGLAAYFDDRRANLLVLCRREVLGYCDSLDLRGVDGAAACAAGGTAANDAVGEPGAAAAGWTAPGRFY